MDAPVVEVEMVMVWDVAKSKATPFGEMFGVTAAAADILNVKHSISDVPEIEGDHGASTVKCNCIGLHMPILFAVDRRTHCFICSV